MNIDQAERSGIEQLTATLVESHLDYAWELWAVRGDARAARLTAAFRSDLDLLGLPHGVVTRTVGCDSVAMWLPDGVGEQLTPEQRSDRDRLADEVFGDRRQVVEEVDHMVGSAPCPQADWQLATMGTLPARQRCGLGSAVLRPMLEQLDADGESARLETSTAGNVVFYRAHGFEVVRELELPHGAPTTWIMYRPPSDAR